MSDLDSLGKIDLLRERMDVSYETAKHALEDQNGNVVDALIYLERGQKNRRGQFFVRGNELAGRIKELVKKANVTKIRVKQDDKLLLELPVSAGVVGAVVAPELAVLGAVAALASRCTLEVERAPDGGLH